MAAQQGTASIHLRQMLSQPSGRRASVVSAEEFYRFVPSLDSVRGAVVPTPQLLAGGEISDVHASECAMWLKGWAKSFFGTTMAYRKNTRFSSKPRWKSLADGIELLREQGFSAPRWLKFNEMLVKERQQKTPPALSRVFSKTLVSSQIAFARDVVPPLGGSIRQLPKYQKLSSDYALLLQDLQVARRFTRDPAQIKKVVSTYFPGGSFARRVAEVRAEAAAEQAVLDDALANYVWIW